MNCLILGYPTKKQQQTDEKEVQELQKELVRLRGQVGGLRKSNNTLKRKLDDSTRGNGRAD